MILDNLKFIELDKYFILVINYLHEKQIYLKKFKNAKI